MRFRFIRRPFIFHKKMGRFLIGAFLATSPMALSQEEDTQPKEVARSSFFAKPKAQIRFGARPSSDNAFAFPAIGIFDLRAGYQLTSDIDLQLSAFGRVPVQANAPHIDAFLDLYDTYLKLKQPGFTFTVGYLRTPWSVLRGSAVNDRLNPVDYRRGVDFAKDGFGRIPQWGFQLSGQLRGFSLEGVYQFWRRPDPASHVFNEQDGVQIGRYQGGLAATRADLAMLGIKDIEETKLPWFSQPTVGFAIRRQFGDFDTGVNFVWGFEEVPRLEFVANPDKLILSPHRSLSLGGELTVSLGIVILKAEAVVTPKIADDVGKATLVKSGGQLLSQSLSGATLALGVDAEYGDSLSGSIELIDTAWFNVAPNTYVYTIEDPSAANADYRFVQRLALALALEGKLFDSVLLWSFRGEVGLIRPDILSTIDLQHNFRDTGFYVGAFANLFFGVNQGVGWFRSSATECGIKFGYQL
jgi:hypothetical protein